MSDERCTQGVWQPADNPPESVQHWWGPDDWDLFRMYRNKDIPNELMELVTSRYMVHKKNGRGSSSRSS